MKYIPPLPGSPRQDLVPMVTPRILSENLFKGASQVEILHGEQCYLLRVTRENKLILTK